MDYILKNSSTFHCGTLVSGDFSLIRGCIAGVSPALSAPADALHLNNCFIFPGFADVHVHLREPGFSYKETIASGTAAAARGGYTCVGAMPNLSPVPDCAEALREQLEIIKRDAVIDVIPYGSITRSEAGKELSDMSDLAPDVIAFSDDGKGVQSDALMKAAMEKAVSLGKLIVAHCEDSSVPSNESEWRQLERDINLVRETGCGYHACHISKRRSVELIRAAKAEGLDITCETAPHYLMLDDSMTKPDGRFKMNPPIGSADDRAALAEALCDGTIDMIATDHAPHTSEEKLAMANGIVGLETAFPVLYTGLVCTGVITLEKLIELMSTNPARRFGLKINGFSVWDLDEEYLIDPKTFRSKGKFTPFENMKVKGRCIAAVCNGNTVWEDTENA